MKTLKDLEWCDEDGVAFGQAYLSELRQEAIKWVKKLDSDRDNAMENYAVTNWIKHFFNLTEEDLK